MITFFSSAKSIFAITIVSQTQNFGNQLNVWQVIQELGDNLNGTAGKFTFRISTAKTHLEQFYFTAQNTRIFDKTDGTTLVACVPTGTNPDQLEGLSFNKVGVPAGYEDVTLDFSCHKYIFIPGHRYLIRVTSGDPISLILFAAAFYGQQDSDLFSGGGLRYGNGNLFDFAHNLGNCNAFTYFWNDPNPTPSSGCFIWTPENPNPKNDLYFVLTNTTPEPPSKTPVIFIPGIGGSEFKLSEDTFWIDQDDGHGGKYSHAYKKNEKIWVNQDKAAELGDDDYFDVLRLKADGETAENPNVTLTGNLTPFGYGEIEAFFTETGYEKDKNFFVYPYDWRKDVRTTKDDLNSLIETAKTKSGKDKVDVVAHSMGGLVARYYISDSEKAKKISKLIELGVPHLGATKSVQTLVYGTSLTKDVFGFIPLGIPQSEVKDVSQNSSGLFELLPTSEYFKFYDGSNKELPYPLSDDRDIDNNSISGALNFSQTKTLLSNLGHNMTVFGIAEQFHDNLIPSLNKNNGIKLYNIVGTNQPTLGQIIETWLIKWPINLITIRDELFINGDGTVPLYSASLKSKSKDLLGDASLYYVEQKHNDLVAKTGSAMQAVKSILNETVLPAEVKNEKINLEGQHLSLDDGELELYDENGNHTGIKDNGEIETNINNTFYSTSGKTKHAFIKKNSKKVQIKITRKNKTSDSPTNPSFKIRQYKEDKVDKTILYKDLPIKETSEIQFDLDPTSNTSPSLPVDSATIHPTSEVSGSPALDQTPPKTNIEVSGSTVTLTATDTDSGVLKIEYSLDNGKTVQVYKDPFTLSGKTTIQVKAIDKLGNEEIPQEKTVEVTSNSTSSTSNSSSSNSSSSSSSTENTSVDKTTSEKSDSSTSEVLRSDSSEVNKSEVLRSDSSEVNKSEVSGSQDILGINSSNPDEIIAQQINQNKSAQSIPNQIIQHLGGLLIVVIGLQGMFPVFASSALTLLKPTPK